MSRLFVSIFAYILLGNVPVYGYTAEQQVDRAAEKVGVPKKLLRAICAAESGLKPWAYRYGDGGSQRNSAFGICQVLHSTAKAYGFRDENCYKDFRNSYFRERNYKACKLFGPYTNSLIAARYLKYQLKRYDGSWISAIAAYNSGSLRICKNGKVRDRMTRKILYRCKKGGLLNQKYIDRVLRILEGSQ